MLKEGLYSPIPEEILKPETQGLSAIIQAVMKLEDALQILKKNAPALHRFGVKSLAVFGSTVRQEATPSSDMDILVLFDFPPTYDQYIETKIFLEDTLNCRVDLVTLDGLKPLVRTEVEKEAVYVT